MQRRIDWLDQHAMVTVSGRPGQRRMQVGDGPFKDVSMETRGRFRRIVRLGEGQAEMQVAVHGETAHIHAFDRIFTLRIVDPVAQAGDESGRSNTVARAPMPGTVVENHVAAGDRVARDQPMITIESMKILTVIAAPDDGQIDRIHFGPGDTFNKNAVLVTLKEREG